MRPNQIPVFRALGVVVLLALASGLRAEVHPGASRAEVMAALGQPQGVLQFEHGEWLLYPRGRVQLEKDRVVHVDLEDPRAYLERREAERREAEAAQRRQQVQRALRIERGEAERDRLLADPGLADSTAEVRYRVWSDFQRVYPEVSAEPHLARATTEYRAEMERRQADQRIAELERKVQEAERVAQETREDYSRAGLISRRYSYYPSVVQPLIVSGYGGYYPVVICPQTGPRIYTAPSRTHGAAVPISRNEWSARHSHGTGVRGELRSGGGSSIRISF